MAMYDLEVQISGDSSQLQKSFRDARESTEAAQEAVEALDETLADETAAGAFSEAIDNAAAAEAALEQVRSEAAETAAAVNDVINNSGSADTSSAPASSAYVEAIDEQREAVEELNEALAETEESIEDIGEEADRTLPEVSEGLDDAADSADGLDDSLDGAAEGAENAERSLRRIAGAAAAITVARKAAAELLDCFKLYSGYESAVMRVSDIFGSSAEAVEDFAERNARALGMSRTAAYNYSATFGNLFRGITADQEENSRVTLAMMNASAVVASKTGRTVSDVMERIRSGLLGNTEAIEDLGIFVNVAMLETTDAFRRMADGRSWEQLEYHEQQQIRTLAILEQANRQFGGEISQNTAMSISSYQAAVEDLKVSLGGLASGVLTPVIQILTSFTRTVSGCVAWVSSLDGATKGYLRVALILAAAIPAVAVATKGLALAQAGLHAVQALLIPQTLTYASALKALLGWAALAAVAFALLHNIFGRSDDTDKAADSVSDYSEALENAQKNASSAASSIGDITNAAKGLNDEVKRSLAGFDELNTLSENSSGSLLSVDVDTEALAEAAELTGTFSDMDYDITFDTNADSVKTRIRKALSTLWSDIKTDFSKWKSWWHGLGEDMQTGIEEGDWEPLLTRLNEKVELLFGSKWTGFWEEAGSNMHEGIKNGNWTPLLEQFDGVIRKLFGNGWSDFWSGVGGKMHEGIANGNWTPLLESAEKGVRALFGDGWTDYWESVGENMYKGIADGDWEPFLQDANKAVRLIFGSGWTDFWEDVGGRMYDIFHKWAQKVENAFNGLKNLFDDISSRGEQLYDLTHRGSQNITEKLSDLARPAIMAQTMGQTAQDYISERGYLGALQSGAFDQMRSAYSKYFTEDEINNIIREAALDYIRQTGNQADLLAFQKYGIDYGMTSALSSLGKISDIFSGKFSAHAKGGILVDRPVLTPQGDLFGEDGREAIIPLENNTEWMDTLAEKIAALIPSGGGGDVPVILDGREVGRFCIKAVEEDRRRKGG